jgi:restriction system protein
MMSQRGDEPIAGECAVLRWCRGSDADTIPSSGENMAKRRINSIEDIVELTAQLPWWAGVAAAVVSWMALYGVARLALPTVQEMDAVVPVAVPVLRGLTMAGLYVLPAVFLAAAALSAWLHYKHRRNYADMFSERGRFLLQHLSWREFENLVAEFFRRKGFSVERRGGRLPEGGVDLVASIGEDRYLVQCKHWRVQRVGVAVVRDLCRIAETEGAAGIFVVTSGSFTDEARRFVEKNRIAIELITGERLRQMIRGLDTTQQ